MSIYRRAMGADFDRLHPQIQRRFGICSRSGEACIGRGVMASIWRGRPYTLPFLYVGAWRRIMFPEQARDVPFTISNYAYVDRFGRETVTWVREFELPHPRPRRRRFDATMIYSEQRSRIVDYLGSHQHLAVDIDLSVGPGGAMHLRSGAQRFYEGPLGFSFPMPFSGVAQVREWYDEAHGRFGIDVAVTNPVWGPLFGYRGWFRADWFACRPEDVPVSIRPVREERRE
jgi:hypothetical protein